MYASFHVHTSMTGVRCKRGLTELSENVNQLDYSLKLYNNIDCYQLLPPRATRWLPAVLRRLVGSRPPFTVHGIRIAKSGGAAAGDDSCADWH